MSFDNAIRICSQKVDTVLKIIFLCSCLKDLVGSRSYVRQDTYDLLFRVLRKGHTSMKEDPITKPNLQTCLETTSSTV